MWGCAILPPVTVQQPIKWGHVWSMWVLLVLISCGLPESTDSTSAGSTSAGSSPSTLIAENYSLRDLPAFAHTAHDQPLLKVLNWSGHPLIRSVVAASHWREPTTQSDGWIVLTQDQRLLWTTGGGVEELDQDVVCSPAIRGEWLVWAAHPQSGDLAVTVRWRGPVRRDLTTPLFSLGSLQIVDDRGTTIGIGAVNGGIAGYQRVGDTFLCLTNCALRTGTPWQGFVPTSADFRVVDAHIEWPAEGHIHRVRWTQ